MSTHPEIAHLPKEERIRSIAYFLWQEDGCPEGRDVDHWTRACELVEAEAADVADPDWLQRAETTAADSVDQPKPEAAAVEEKKSSLDDLVKRMKGSRAA
jgi:Protein of unknown function (DUF2934)